jgi:hypothetical protein
MEVLLLNNDVDLIGDIHGHADELHELLKQLGYKEIDGVYRHPERSVVFLGDFIDRGPDQLEVLRIAQSMCNNGSARAIMGNHEFNAIGWVTENENGHFLRSHDVVHREQHEEFLKQIVENSKAHQDAINWFWSLPILIDHTSYRAVHACWHNDSIKVLREHCLDEDMRFTLLGFNLVHQRKSELNEAMEIVLKGPEEKLPEGMSFRDKSGHERHEARIKWWDRNAITFAKAALGMDGREAELPDAPIPSRYHYNDKTPVFFGHYWLKGKPIIESENALCLDYSVAKKGSLVAYRHDHESKLNEKAIVSIPSQNKNLIF